ncbi:MAG TPA: DUF2306 domain-containing protein [Bryobacteraceae bacterium]|jgi:uncharacterized membrane protein
MKPRPALVRIVWTITLFLMLIGVAIVVRRSLTLFTPSPAPSNFPEAAQMDTGFARHRLLTMLHITPGLVFILLAPLQFVRRLRSRKPKLHRWIGRIVLVAGLIIGSSALVMSPQMAIGGPNESAATMLFAIVFLVSLVKAYVHARKRRFALHREWMIRAFAVGFAVATIRPIVGIFFATSRFTHLTPHDFFGTAFWLGFTIQFMVAEIWIGYTRPSGVARPQD